MQPITKRLYNALYSAAFVFRVTRERSRFLYGYTGGGFKRELCCEGSLPRYYSFSLKLDRKSKKIIIYSRKTDKTYVMTFDSVRQFDAYLSGLVVMWNISWYTIKCMPKEKRLRKFAYLPC